MSRAAAHDTEPGLDVAWSEVRAFVRESLGRPFDQGEVRLVTVPAPTGEARAVLRLRTDEPAIYWGGAGDGRTMAGYGAARALAAPRGDATGAGRFQEVRAAADGVWSAVTTDRHPSLDADAVPAPRLFGGFAFQPGRAAGPWSSFGDARFVLPRVLYCRPGTPESAAGSPAAGIAAIPSARSATLTLALEAGSDADALDAELEALRRALVENPAPVDAPVTAAPLGADMDRAAWTEAVASIQSLIAEGRAGKVVAARRIALELRQPADAAAVLRRLARDNAGETRFAFRHGDATFLGATPERLVTRSGRTVRTEAIAGSLGLDAGTNGQQPGASRLLGSAKDTGEHRYVVDAIATALEPLCQALEYPDRPDVRRLRHVLHLRTPFVGRLRQPTHVLELVERLHPTPAVGGTPTDAALEWIARHEPADRGWYAAPVGWFDAAGDGDFVVALRSGLLHQGRAYLYAGAGIVRDSEPAAEFEETETKLRTMMDALGIVA